MEVFSKRQKIIIMGVIFLIALILWFYYNYKNEEDEYIEMETFENITEQNIEIEEENNKIFLHITGEVKKEGVIELEEGARLIDVIEKAEGITKDADLSKVNLAYKVQDGQKIYIPNVNEELEENFSYITYENSEEIIVDSAFKNNNYKVNINTASQTELETLSGIGPSTALKIINYREENGNFRSNRRH